MAPRRARAKLAMIVSKRFGTCQVTRVPWATPNAANPAAARSARSRNSLQVSVRPPSSRSSTVSGVAAARRSTSSQSVVESASDAVTGAP